MPVVDKRDTVEHLHTGGSDVGLHVFLSDEEATAIYGDTAVEGWYCPFTFEGGTVAYAVESEEDRDEADQLTGKTIISSESFRLTNTVKETSDEVLDLLDKCLTKSFHKYRYALPVGVKMVEGGAGGEVEADAHQLWGAERAKITPGYELSTTANEKRTFDIELVSSKYQGTPAFVRVTVDLEAEASWPPELEPFKTTQV